MVTDMKSGSWKQQGLGEGFIVLRVDGNPIMTVEDVFEAAQMARAAQQDGMLIEGMHAMDNERMQALPSLKDVLTPATEGSVTTGDLRQKEVVPSQYALPLFLALAPDAGRNHRASHF